METDIKCEIASKMVDYIWYNHIHKNNLTPPHHTIEKKDAQGYENNYYLEQAQDIFNHVLDIIDDYTE